MTKTQPQRICEAGHTIRKQRCECGKSTVIKDSPEGHKIIEAAKGKIQSRGSDKYNGAAGFRPHKKAYGDCESAVKANENRRSTQT